MASVDCATQPPQLGHELRSDLDPSRTAQVVPKAELEIMMQLIDEEWGLYRLRTGTRIRYLDVQTSVFDDDTMCIPSLFLPALPPLPDTGWTHATITRDASGALETVFKSTPRASAEHKCHDRRIDVLSIPRVDRFNGKGNTYEVELDGARAFAKIANFGHQMYYMESELAAYAHLEAEARFDPAEPRIAPRVLAHITENDDKCVIGLVLEKLHGTAASIDDLAVCTSALQQLHALGVLHGDVNRFNFLVDREAGRARVVDFEHARPLVDEDGLTAEEVGEREIATVPDELTEETGRGGPSITMTEEEFERFAEKLKLARPN